MFDHKSERALHSPPGKSVEIDGSSFLNFSGSYYLDLSGHPAVIEAGCAAARKYGMNSDLGYSIVGKPILDIETYGAQALGFESCVYCTSAFVAVMIVAEFLSDSYAHALIDEKAHHSIRFGLKMAGMEAKEFRHCDADHLDSLARKASDPVLIMTDGVFPTWGDIAPVREYLAIARSVSAPLVVDDAHGLGILGETGAGVFEHSGITDTSGTFLIGSLSKALGCQGALIGMTSDQKAKIKSYSPIYNSISLPTMATIAAGHRALELARDRRHRENIARLRGDVLHRLGQLGIDIADSGTPIVTFSLGSKARNDAVFEQLYQHGILIIRSDYVGAPNEGALRITIMASHSQNDIERLCAAIQGALAVASE